MSQNVYPSFEIAVATGTEPTESISPLVDITEPSRTLSGRVKQEFPMKRTVTSRIVRTYCRLENQYSLLEEKVPLGKHNVENDGDDLPKSDPSSNYADIVREGRVLSERMDQSFLEVGKETYSFETRNSEDTVQETEQQQLNREREELLKERARLQTERNDILLQLESLHEERRNVMLSLEQLRNQYNDIYKDLDLSFVEPRKSFRRLASLPTMNRITNTRMFFPDWFESVDTPTRTDARINERLENYCSDEPIMFVFTIGVEDDEAESKIPNSSSKKYKPTSRKKRKGRKDGERDSKRKPTSEPLLASSSKTKLDERSSRKKKDDKKRNRNKNKTSPKEEVRFTRESSEVPEGGYYAQTRRNTRPPSTVYSDSSDSSSESDVLSDSPSSVSSSSDSDSSSSERSDLDEHRQRKKRKNKRKALKKTLPRMKIKSPPVYNGTADLDVFDQWVFSVQLWKESLGLNNEFAVKFLVHFVSEKASVFYMKHVALNTNHWRLGAIFDALFDYCFPPDYKLTLRRRLMNSYQGKKPFRDFARDTESLAKRFPDMSSRQSIQIIWDGAIQHIRLEWVKAGCSPESTPLRELIDKATRYEAAETLRIKENNRFTYRNEIRQQNSSSENPSNPAGGRDNDIEEDSKSESELEILKTSPEREERLTKQEMNELRAQGRCFVCRVKGHIARNCPSRQTAPAIPTNTLVFGEQEESASEEAELEYSASEMESRQEEIEIFTCGVGFGGSSESVMNSFPISRKRSKPCVHRPLVCPYERATDRKDVPIGNILRTITRRTNEVQKELSLIERCYELMLEEAELDSIRFGLNSGITILNEKKVSNDEKADLGVERTETKVDDFTRKLPNPIVIEVLINGSPCRALVDSGSMTDLMSMTLADRLKVERKSLTKPLMIKMAVQASRSILNYETLVNFKYQNINSRRHFDIVNLEGYDLILGTPFLFQHKVLLGLNPSCVIIGVDEPGVTGGESESTSVIREIFEETLTQEQFQRKEDGLPSNPVTAELMPVRGATCFVLSPDEKIRTYRGLKRESLRSVLFAKKNAHIQNRERTFVIGTNTSHMLNLPKPSKADGRVKIRRIFDMCQQDPNPRKMSIHLQKWKIILRNVVCCANQSLMGGNAYGERRLKTDPEDEKIFTIPDGTVSSLVLHRAENGCTTYKMFMLKHTVVSYLGVRIDIKFYSDDISEHPRRTTLDVRCNEIFLSLKNGKFFADNGVEILGISFRIFTDQKTFIGGRKNLSPQLIRWLDTRNGCYFKNYDIPGLVKTTVLVDTLSGMNYDEFRKLVKFGLIRSEADLSLETKIQIRRDQTLGLILMQRCLNPRQNNWLDGLDSNGIEFKSCYLPRTMRVLVITDTQVYLDEPRGIIKSDNGYRKERRTWNAETTCCGSERRYRRCPEDETPKSKLNGSKSDGLEFGKEFVAGFKWIKKNIYENFSKTVEKEKSVGQKVKVLQSFQTDVVFRSDKTELNTKNIRTSYSCSNITRILPTTSNVEIPPVLDMTSRDINNSDGHTHKNILVLSTPLFDENCSQWVYIDSKLNALEKEHCTRQCWRANVRAAATLTRQRMVSSQLATEHESF